jgi:hypothetical protein
MSKEEEKPVVSSPTSTNSLSSPTHHSLYENKTLMCKNNCGYYGNSIQYNGFCSICYRQLNTKPTSVPFLLNPSLFFDDSSFSESTKMSSLGVPPSPSTTASSSKTATQIYDQTNLSKFSTKQEKRHNSAFKLFRRSKDTNQSSKFSNQSLQISSNNSALNLVDSVVNKVTDKAANLVDQSLSNLSSINNSLTSSISSSSIFTNDSNSLLEFNNSLNKLLTSSLTNNNPATSDLASSILFGLNCNDNISHNKLSAIESQATALSEFEEQFRLAFPQLYQDLIKQLRQFVERFLEEYYRRKNPTTLPSSLASQNAKQSEIIQEFYKKIYKYIQTSASIRSFLDKLIALKENKNNDSSNSSILNSSINNNYSNQNSGNESLADNLYEAIMIMVESFVNKSIYDYVFPSIMSEFEDQDMHLQKRIRSFYWITNEMIGTVIDEESIFYRDLYEEALNCK